MKQYPTLKEWNQLNQNQQRAFLGGNVENPHTVDSYGFYVEDGTLSIGGMIEFIGDEWFYKLYSAWNGGFGGAVIEQDFEGELCDALWETVVGIITLPPE